MYVCMYASGRMLFVVSFSHFLFSVYISVCILYIVGSMFAIILCQIVTHPSGAVVSTDIRPSVDGLYRDGTVHISREMRKQGFITRPEMTSRAPKPHRHRSRTFL